MRMHRPARWTAPAALVLATLLAACSSAGGNTVAAGTTVSPTSSTSITTASTAPAGTTTLPASGGTVTLRLGYFANITHATALVGVAKGIFAKDLGPNVTLKTKIFNAGPAEIEALFADAIDAGYLGPNPAINGFVQSHGEALRIISGATSGGALLVVKPNINSAAGLRGKVLATPQLGNTQDVALRAWLLQQGLKSDTNGGGDVSIRPQDNAQTLDTFKSGQIQGAWVPEPWASRLVLEGGGKVLVDERTLWPGGLFVTTHLIVSTKFLSAHPDVVKALLEGQVDTNDFLRTNETDAQKIANDEIGRITGKKLADRVVGAAWGHMVFTDDPIASSLLRSAQAAEAVGLLKHADLSGIYDLTLLNQVLAERGRGAVSGP